MWTTKLLKERFLRFFESRNHRILPGISVIPPNDPTLLFTNSGMVQFKNIFLGDRAQYPRVCTVQRCIRAGGKHNDLDDVGMDNYHHTFFEMLGNWSFGDYFKEDAIRFAYEFLIDELKIDPERIYVTIYEELDKESRLIWKKYLDDSRILNASFKDNFWEMGEFGPCGPCTEIHYDRIGNRDASHLVNQDDPNVIEIWNIVFMEYNRTPTGLEELKQKNIDTGIGFERLLSILMGVNSNYQIDSFQSIITEIEKYSFADAGYKYTDGSSLTDIAVRVLADHARTMAVCISDKVFFSSDGVGYVLRRILRRAVRYTHDVLNISPGKLSHIVAHAARIMELSIDTSIINEEEALFMKTLKNGSLQFDKIVKQKGSLDAKDVFLLYDTYGFPTDLTEVLAKEKKVPVSLEGFEMYKAKAQDLSRSHKSVITINFSFDKTKDGYKYTENNIRAHLQAVVHENSIISNETAEKIDGKIFLIFDQTCFYAEKGGQVGDKGLVKFYDEKCDMVGTFDVIDTQSIRGYVLHEGILTGRISQEAELIFSEELRALTRSNHSTCHILYYFLKTFFSTTQRGSLVDSEKCRFDFEGEKLSDSMIEKLEEKINNFVQSGASRDVKVISYEDALKDTTLHLEDGDYSSGVRIVSFSNETMTIHDPCGGTHVQSTNEIRKVRIISEASTQAHVRRIIAVTNVKADEADKNAEQLLEAACNGDVVPTDCLLPISARNKIESMNKTNARQQHKKMIEKVAEKTNKYVEDMKAKILIYKTESLLNKNDDNTKAKVFEYKVTDEDDFSKKDMAKVVSVLTLNLGFNNTEGLVSAKKGEDFYLGINSQNKDKFIAFLSTEFGEKCFRLDKQHILGSVRGDNDVVVKILEHFDKIN